MVQPVPKQMTREEKEEKVEEFKEKIEDYPVIGMLDMHNLPSRQLQQMKKEMKEFADIKMSRKTLMQIAIDQADKEDIEQLKENDAVQPAFMFSEKDPFQLYQLIQENKTSAAAEGGETAPNDIEIPEGDTGIGPGPMLGKLQQAGLNVQVEEGSIHVQSAGVIVEKGEVITEDDAEILNQMGIEPLEIGLTLDVAYSEGELFSAEELDIDTEQYRSDVESAAGAAFNLAVNAGIINETTAEAIISEAVQKARNLAISEGLPVEETIEEALAQAKSNADGLDSQIDLDSVDLEDSEEDESEEEESDEEAESEESEDSGEESEEEEE
ncbi:MAG: 50S ribosomal protein L10 [Candidatus Nanohalobium sp.]